MESDHQFQSIMSQLEQAAQLVLAPPNLVTSEQRHAAESIYHEFKSTKSPYPICKYLLENSKIDYVLFQAASTVKDACIREWSLLQTDDIKSLRTYLLQYIIAKPQLQNYVREQVLQAVAVIFKRGTLETDDEEHDQLLENITQLIHSGNSSMQSLACSILMSLMNEYSTTTKSSCIGLSWEFHLNTKRIFETRDLKKLFQLCLHVLQELEKVTAPPSREFVSLINKFLAITENVLSWRFTAFNLVLPGRFALVIENSQSSALMPGPSWREVLLNPELVQFFFRVYDKVRSNPELAHHGLQCLCQLASLRGSIFRSDEDKVQYLTNYLRSYVTLISREDIEQHEALGVSTIISRLSLFFPVIFFAKLSEDLRQMMKISLTKMTCKFAHEAVKQQLSPDMDDDTRFIEAYEKLLDSWVIFLTHSQQFPSDYFIESSVEVFNSYISCHLAPPNGTRIQMAEEIIEEMQEEDRIKYSDQLMCIGLVGRQNLSHSLPLLTRLLEERIQQLYSSLQNQFQSPLSIANKSLENLHEDIHWLLLVASCILTEDHFWEGSVIPTAVMDYSLKEAPSVNVQASVKMLVNPSDLSNRENTDPIVRLIATVFSLCEMEKQAILANMLHLLSPQVSCTIMWFLRRWVVVYLLPDESSYSQLSMPLNQAFGRDSETGKWVVKFLLSKITSNLSVWTSEKALMKDTVQLLVALVCHQECANEVIKCEDVWMLAKQQAANEPPLCNLPSQSKRGLLKALVLAGTANKEKEVKEQFLSQIIRPLEEKFKMIVTQPSFNQVKHEESVRSEIINLLEAFCGVAEACHPHNISLLFPALQPILRDSIQLLAIYNNYSSIVELVLDFYLRTAASSVCYLGQKSSKHLYECAVSLIQTYAEHNTGKRIVDESQEEEQYRDILLMMELLTQLLSKEFIDFSLTDNEEEADATEGVAVSAANIALYGLNLIMPMMNAELLRFPALCNQYFKLITFISEIYPDKICQIPQNLYQNLMASVEIGLTTFGNDIMLLCMEFLSMIGTYVASTNDEIPSHCRALLEPFLKLLVDMLLHQNFDLDQTSSASITFFSLICCFQEQYKGLVRTLISSQTDATISERLTECFNSLTPPELPLVPTRPNKINFRRNFEKHMGQIKALLCVK